MTQEERDKKMIEDFLKKNEPSVKIEHNLKMPHIQPSGVYGTKD